jgi:diguanylate cyclase (GGDEF)-like protein
VDVKSGYLPPMRVVGAKTAASDETDDVMRSLSARLGVGVVYACVFFGIVAAAIGVVGILAVGSATATGNSITSDELATATITAQFGQQVDAVYASGQALALTSDPAQRAQIANSLYSQQLPATDSALSSLQRIHAGDGAAEQTAIGELSNQWTTFRNLLNPATLTARADAALAAQLSTAYQPLTSHIGALIGRENADGRDDQAQASASSRRARWLIAGAVIAAILATIGLGWTAIRRLKRAVEPGEDQIEFADTLQLAEDEDEAHQLLQRHLERTVSHSTVTVLNRNNSADRLEAVTALPTDSPLIATLAHAEPRACLAVRSGRSHEEDSHRPALLGCPVCAQCPGSSTCTPLTVGGEVIGSVLVNRPVRYNGSEQQHIRDSVGQAAPVLANLRNLAIAELRAATDSLTGLPNKRAVGDTLKRMLAQASRTFTPLSLLLLDLDHFKDINDRFGHPAGDQALANVGAALRSVIRDSDFAGRNGGEEFAVMLPNTDASGAVLTADKIRAAIAEISLPGLELAITASVGIATYPDHATGPDRLESLADSALYLAKRTGRDRIELAVPPSDSARLAGQPVIELPV